MVISDAMPTNQSSPCTRSTKPDAFLLFRDPSELISLAGYSPLPFPGACLKLRHCKYEGCFALKVRELEGTEHYEGHGRN